MPSYSGKFQCSGPGGESLGQGACEVTFDAEHCVVAPAGGTPLAFDLGDVDSTRRGEWDFQLALYSGQTIVLRQFGAAFGNMAEELVAAWRNRTVQCLLLEDLEELGRYACVANGHPGELRVFKSNIAFLPQEGLPMQWRLAEVESVAFDSSSYSVVMARGGDRLVLSKLAKKTDEAMGRIEQVRMALREHAAVALHDIFPFLSADRLVQVQTVMPEGRSASVADLNAIHPKLGEALIGAAVDEALHPYFEALRSRASGEPLMAGFKFIRADEDEAGEKGAADEEKSPLFFWFFFPLPNGAAAWEATTGTGRATYLFRAPSPVAGSIGSLTRGLALVNFRREPVYLPDESLDRQPRFHRYAIGARKLPELRTLRAAYMGRAIHSSVEEWRAQLDGVLAGRS